MKFIRLFFYRSLVTALINRLMHHRETIVIQGDSYRMRGKDSDSPSA
jgi:DNA replication protein DnaC